MESSPGGFAIVPEEGLSIGSVLGKALETLKNYPIFFFGLALVTIIPSASFLFMDPIFLYTNPQYMIIIGLINLTLALLGQGMVSYAVFKALKGEEFTVGDTLIRGLSRLPIMFVSIILLVLFGMIFGILYGLTMMAGRYTGPVSIIVIIGLAVLGLYFFCRWLVTFQACVVEKTGPVASFSRSTELTEGNRLKLLGLILIVGAVDFAIKTGGSAVFAAISQNTGAILFINALLGFPMTAFGWLVLAIIYFDLRRVKEGLSLDNLADIFD